jgi:hypothetical protein
MWFALFILGQHTHPSLLLESLNTIEKVLKFVLVIHDLVKVEFQVLLVLHLFGELLSNPGFLRFRQGHKTSCFIFSLFLSFFLFLLWLICWLLCDI